MSAVEWTVLGVLLYVAAVVFVLGLCAMAKGGTPKDES